MSKNKNGGAEMKGIYVRGKTYWIQLPMKNGHRPAPITLETDELGEAIKRAAEIRENPLLTKEARFDEEIKAFADYKVRMREWTADSKESKRAVLLAFAATLSSHFTAAAVTAPLIQKYHDGLQKRGLSDSTVNGYMMAFKSFFNWAVGVQKIMRRSPMENVKIVKTEGKARKDFADFELRDKLITEAPDDDLKFILYAGFHWGLRKREIMEARPFWFDLDGGMLHLRKTSTMQFKDREERAIPMSKESVAFMRRYGLHAPFVLKPEVAHGKSRYRYDFRAPFDAYMKAQGAEWVTPHIMRHTFASLLASAGVSIFKIAMWLGDDVATVQKHYAKLLPADKDIEKAFGGKKAAERKRKKGQQITALPAAA